MKMNGMRQVLTMFCGGLFFIAVFNVSGAEKNAKSELSFSVSFDHFSADADFAKGDGKSSCQASLELRATDGVKKNALLLDPNETCRYPVKGNLDMKSASLSMWVKPFNWDSSDKRYIYFFNCGSGNPRFRIQVYVPEGKGAVLYCCFGKRGTSDFRAFSVRAPIKWKKGEWHKIDAAWDSETMKIYLDGRLGEKIKLPNVKFPSMDKANFYLSPIWSGPVSEEHNPKDRSVIDEFKIYNGVLSGEQIKINYLADRASLSGGVEESLVSVPLLAGEPKIDGRLDDPQWSGASSFPIRVGVDSFISDKISRASLFYGKDKLFIAFSAPVSDHPPVANQTVRDGRLWEDDSFELFLYPFKDLKKNYQIIVNSKGVVFDSFVVDKGWNGNYQVAGSVGKKRWSVEMAIPFAALGVEPPKPGTEWKANFCRDWWRPKPKTPLYTAWVEFMGGFAAGRGIIKFNGTKAASRISLGANLASGSLALECDNNSKNKVTCEVAVTAKNTPEFKRVISIPSDASGKIDGALNGFKNGIFSLKVAGEGDKIPLLRYVARIYVKDPLEVEYIPFFKKTAKTSDGTFERFKHNSLKGANEDACVFHIDMSNLDEEYLKKLSSENVTLNIKAIAPDSSEYSKTFTIKSMKVDCRLPLKWVDGKYKFNYTLTAPGLSPVNATGSLIKPPTPWINASAAVSERVLRPWTPLVYKKNGNLSLWGRQYELRGPLPSSMISQGKEQLTAPVTLAMRTDKGEAALTVDKINTVYERPNRGIWDGTAQFKGLGGTVEWRTFVEYDGLIATRLVLTPPKSGWKIKSLIMTIPLKTELLKYIRHPKRVEWDGKKWESSFEPYLWVGTEKVGFDCFFNSDANWNYGPKQNPTVVSVGTDSAKIAFHIVMKEALVKKPLTYIFGFQSTPIKPMMKNWRAVNNNTRSWKGRNTCNWNTQFSTRQGLFEVAIPKEFEKVCRKKIKEGVKLYVYGGALCTSDATPTFDFFKSKWSNPYGSTFTNQKTRKSKINPGTPLYNLVPVSQASSYTDYMAWQAEQLMKNHSLNSIYTDMDRLLPDENAYHGSGYRNDAFGRSGPTYDILERRQFYKRLLTVCRDAKKGIGMGMRQTHAHDNLVLPYHAFNDMFYPGEQYSQRMYKHPNFYIDDLNPLAWRVELNGRPMGINHMFLPEFGRGTRKKEDSENPDLTDTLNAMLILNDLISSGSYCERKTVEAYWAMRKRLGIVDDSTRFIGYWEPETPVKTSTANAFVSVYITKRSVLLAVVNKNKKKRIVTVELDLKKLGFSSAPKAVDERSGKELKCDGGKLSVEVKGRNYTVVSLKSL